MVGGGGRFPVLTHLYYVFSISVWLLHLKAYLLAASGVAELPLGCVCVRCRWWCRRSARSCAH